MEKTPLSMRKHIALVGQTNSGKSTLFNLLLGQDISIVSEVRGTTTDPVTKAMELIPYGPVALMDTAGLGDETELGKQRMEKTSQALERVDLVLYIVDVSAEGGPSAVYFSKPTVIVFTKCELLDADSLQWMKQENPDAIFLSNYGKDGLEQLKERMVTELKKQDRDDETWIGDLLPVGSTVVLVTPIDSAAPKGRLILPQVQILRDCLDHDMKAYVTKENTLKDALRDLSKIDLVVTDSQVFSLVDAIVPKEIPLTSFSMLLARKKGNFAQYLQGVKQFAQLKDGDKILVMEGCTHNVTHEDIGRKKLPKLIEMKTGVRCIYDFATGYDFPEDISQYAMALSCGMCMINKQEIQSRMQKMKEIGVPVVNYGIALAYLNGILDRAKEIFE
ncbi:MAG: [FeFe] hydrogenase H-cluster maturation GTPase HydF [Clostridia bacterium]|nr:[FeFe] hydrogenase H-cluster maturation GTPase HydF [Clostridia bacterium]